MKTEKKLLLILSVIIALSNCGFTFWSGFLGFCVGYTFWGFMKWVEKVIEVFGS